MIGWEGGRGEGGRREGWNDWLEGGGEGRGEG